MANFQKPAPPKRLPAHKKEPAKPIAVGKHGPQARGQDRIPVCVKHMTVAIYNGQHIEGTGSVRFLNSFMVARFQLMQYGYLTGGSDQGPVEGIKLTSAGRKLEREKLSSKGTTEKQAKFDRMYIAWTLQTEAKSKETQKPS